jgi:hypothetical protein
MPQYMLLLHRTAGSTMKDLGPAELQAIFQRYQDWSDKMREAGRLVAGNKLADGAGRVLARGAGKKVVVRDGPFAETKEVVGGFFTIDAKDYDEAVALASDCPHLDLGGKIEVREVDLCPSAAKTAAACAAGARA